MLLFPVDTEKLYYSVSACAAAARIVYKTEKGAAECGCAEPLLKVENAVLKLAATQDVVQSLLYISILQKKDKVLIR